MSPALPGLRHLPAGRTLVMGVVNTTPDSFSDGGLHGAVGDPGWLAAVVAHAEELLATARALT